MINKQKTYYPEYESFNFSLWRTHLKHKKKFDKSAGIKTGFLELLSFFGMEKSGYTEFDFIVAGDDPLLSLIISLEKIMAGKRVLIYPSQMTEEDNSKIFNLINKRSNLINHSVSLYIKEKYDLQSKNDYLTLTELLQLLSEKINDFKDDQGNPLCYLYKGRELYSDIKFKEKYNGKQIYWPRSFNLKINNKWDIPLSKINRYSLLSKEKSNKDVKGFILSERAILTSRTHSSFCDNYYNPPIKIADSFCPMEDLSRFTMQHRLADVISSMAINKIEKEPSVKNNIDRMYEVNNEQ